MSELPEYMHDWPGMEDPNYTPVPDGFFDVLLPLLTDPELRVLLYLIRRTYGFKKPTDKVSLTQIVKGIKTRDGRQLDSGAGVSRSGAILAVQRLEARGIIVVTRQTSTDQGHEANTYSIRKAGAGWSTASTRVVHAIDQGSAGPNPPLVQPVDPQETVQETIHKNGSAHLMREQIRRDRPDLPRAAIDGILADWQRSQQADWLAWWQERRHLISY